MGSYGFLNDLDIKTSYDFLLELINNKWLCDIQVHIYKEKYIDVNNISFIKFIYFFYFNRNLIFKEFSISAIISSFEKKL